MKPNEITFQHRNFGRFSVRSISGDGNCLFRAMAHYVLGDQTNHILVRHMVVHHICDHWDYFTSFARDEDATSYQRRMKVAGTYGGEMEIVAFTDVFICRVEVFLKSSPKRDPLSFGTEGLPCLVLYSGLADCGHYDVLELKDQGFIEEYREAVTSLRQRVHGDFQEALEEVYDEDVSDLTLGEIINIMFNFSLHEGEKANSKKPDRK